MKIETIVADDMQQGMAMVRKKLGKNAVLISTKGVEGGIEIMASNNFNSDEPEVEKTDVPTEEIAAKDSMVESTSSSGKRFDPFKPKRNSSVYLQDMQEELARLRKLFEGELAQLTWRESGDREPNRLALLSRLDLAGFNRSLQGKIVDKILPCKDLEMAWRRTQRLLNKIIQISKTNIMEEGGTIVLMGATGVGKTVTAGKIAAQFAKLHGKNQVAFVNLDNKYLGGHGQIVSLGTSLGIPVQNVNSIDELENTLDSFSERKLVIIDTGGLNQRDASMIKNFQMLTKLDRNIKPYLVLSATTQESLIYETIQSFSGINLAGAVITKIDESSFVGPVLSGLIRKKLPIAFIGNGQNIPDDLLPANSDILVKAVVESYEHSFRTEKSINNENMQKTATTATSWNFIN